MPLTTDLEGAGRRAAVQPVPAAPALATLEQQAGRRRSKRRALGGGMAVLALVAMGVPIALSLRLATPTQTVSAGPLAQQIAPPASQVDDSDGSQPAGAAGTQSVASAQDDTQEEEGEATFDLRYGPDLSLSIKVLRGEGAEQAAATAEAGADETRTVDDITVWIARDSDVVTVAGLVEPGTYVEVTGPADQLDRLLDVLESRGVEMHEFPAFPHADIEKFFDEFGADFERFGEDFERFQGEDFSFFFDFDDDQRPGFGFFGHGLGDGEGPHFEFFPDEGEWPDFNEFFEHFDSQRDSFFADGCIVIDGNDDFEFEFPPGCSSAD